VQAALLGFDSCGWYLFFLAEVPFLLAKVSAEGRCVVYAHTILAWKGQTWILCYIVLVMLMLPLICCCQGATYLPVLRVGLLEPGAVLMSST
jgi:hypothetical protein